MSPVTSTSSFRAAVEYTSTSGLPSTSRWSMGPQGNTFGLQQTAPPRVGTGLLGSYTNSSCPAALGSDDNVRPAVRYRGVYFVRAIGHSRSSRHRFAPITKIRTGAYGKSGTGYMPFIQCVNQFSWS